MLKFIGESRGDNYYKIQMQPLSISESNVAQAFDQSRFDPRLMEIMTEFIRDFWWCLNPQELNKMCKKANHQFMFKASISVILDSCKISS